MRTVVETMNVNKPLGGKQKGVYILFPESEYKLIRDIALRKKMTVDQYCEMIIRNAFQGAEKPFREMEK